MSRSFRVLTDNTFYAGYSVYQPTNMIFRPILRESLENWKILVSKSRYFWHWLWQNNRWFYWCIILNHRNQVAVKKHSETTSKSLESLRENTSTAKTVSKILGVRKTWKSPMSRKTPYGQKIPVRSSSMPRQCKVQKKSVINACVSNYVRRWKRQLII